MVMLELVFHWKYTRATEASAASGVNLESQVAPE